MNKTIICYCPVCRRETLHTIYKINGWGEKSNTLGLLTHGILTGGVGFFDIETVCECVDCGNKKRI